MIGFTYLVILLVAIGCMGLIDWRHRLVFAAAPVRASLVLAAGLAYFLAWDVLGIALGIFFRGRTPYMTGVLLGHELPLEELFFLTFLCYLTLVLFTGFHRGFATGSLRAGGA